MLAQYQQGGRGRFRWWGKPEKTHRKLVWNRKNRVDITKHKCRDIGLPDGMGVPYRQAAQGDGSTRTTLSGHCHSGLDILAECGECPSPAYFRNARNSIKSSGYFRLYVTSCWKFRRLLKSLKNPEILINIMSVDMSNYLKKLFVIFLIDTENFNAKSWVVLKILPVIDGSKHCVTSQYHPEHCGLYPKAGKYTGWQ